MRGSSVRGKIMTLKPIPLWQSLAIFGLPGLAIYFGTHELVPRLVQSGLPLIFSWTLCVVGPIVLNALIIVGWYVFQERPDWHEFRARFRLGPVRKSFLWSIPLTVFIILLLNQALAWTIPYLSNFPLTAPPAFIPELFSNAYESLGASGKARTFLGFPIEPSSWWLVPFWIFFWVFLAVVSEELVWRGYVLPRQELVYGKYAWLVNGFLWNVPFHLYTIHSFASDFPLYLILPFLSQNTKNNTVGILIHALLVSLALIILLSAFFSS